jgi:cytochrome b561
MSAPRGYSATQIVLHWVVALLIVVQFVFHETMVDAWHAVRQGETLAFDPWVFGHVAAGFLIFALVLWRLVLRTRRGVPLPPENEPAPLKRLSHVAHWGFYAVLVVMSVSGAMAWFGGVGFAAEVHEVLKVLLLLMVALHVLAVPFHRLVLKNDVMQRMLRSSV